MPDVLEVPYRPPVYRGGEPGKKAFTYLLTGRSCLAGDVIGEYSFDVALGAGEQVVFEDMALYTMVKTNTFNGMPLPLIAIRRADGTDESCVCLGMRSLSGDFPDGDEEIGSAAKV